MRKVIDNVGLTIFVSHEAAMKLLMSYLQEDKHIALLTTPQLFGEVAFHYQNVRARSGTGLFSF